MPKNAKPLPKTIQVGPMKMKWTPWQLGVRPNGPGRGGRYLGKVAQTEFTIEPRRFGAWSWRMANETADLADLAKDLATAVANLRAFLESLGLAEKKSEPKSSEKK
jgi:hypothetical protein